MEKCIDHLYAFAIKSKWNAHVAALFCNCISDITVQDTKFRTHLLRKLQAVYKGKIEFKIYYNYGSIFLCNEFAY